ncbi:MAG: hypothetical protein KDJ38_20470, partial [Gammaproteobacteria bacterium]|nr:hypothetical protein [Gammaproteobacteria bacterium]
RHSGTSTQKKEHTQSPGRARSQEKLILRQEPTLFQKQRAREDSLISVKHLQVAGSQKDIENEDAPQPDSKES